MTGDQWRTCERCGNPVPIGTAPAWGSGAIVCDPCFDEAYGDLYDEGDTAIFGGES